LRQRDCHPFSGFSAWRLLSAILGLNAGYADSAACLLVDGKLIAAAQEERFRRAKHWAGLPTSAIDYCLREAKLRLTDIEHIAINHKPGANKSQRLRFMMRYWPQPRSIWRKIRNLHNHTTMLQTLESAYGLKLKAKLHYIEHQLAHLTSAYLVSGFPEAACVSVDGFGDFGSTMTGFGRSNQIKIKTRIYFPHSLGILYSTLAQFLGFPHYGDECKVMDLAPYGEPSFLDQMREIVRIRSDGTFRLNLKYFRHQRDDVSETWNDSTPSLGLLYRHALIDLLGPARSPDQPLEQKHKDIARSTQSIYEKAFFSLLSAVHRQHPLDQLTLAGGCAMNSVANGKVCRRTPFKKIYLPSAANDAGGAVGSAAYVYSQLASGNDRKEEKEQTASYEEQRAEVYEPYKLGDGTRLDKADLGPESTDEELHALLDWKKREIELAGCSTSIVVVEEELLGRTAETIAAGKVVGWFQGRMEWGPFALGNRSILADPRRADIKEVLNAKIKYRESFRPFAASVLREFVSEWFEQDDDVPFMTQVFQVRAAKRAFIPAVTHVDGSSKLQTVRNETNPRYWNLISAFRSITGIPMVLNTSLRKNEPIVCYPEEALDCFLSTRMDVLVLGNFFIERR
jgi:carbamoyltransferase